MNERRPFAPPPEIEGERRSAFRGDVDLARRPPGDEPERDAFLASPPGRRLGARIAASAARVRGRRRVAAVAALAAGVAFVAVGLALVGPRAPPDREDGAARGTEVRLKGGPGLFVFRKGGGEVAQLSDGAIVQPGDRLRFVVRAEVPYLMIVDVEERGEVRPFYPHPAGPSLRVEPGKRIDLPGSIELDESAGTERIVAVFSAAPLSFDEVRAALEAAYPKILGRRDVSQHRPVDLRGAVRSLRIVKRGRGDRP